MALLDKYARKDDSNPEAKKGKILLSDDTFALIDAFDSLNIQLKRLAIKLNG